MTEGTDEPAQPADPVFELREATVAFDGTPVLSEVSLTIEAGSFVALLGANGSGKTTLVRAMLGLQPLASGSAWIHGHELARFRDWQRISFVPQRLPAATGVPISALELVASARISPRTRWRRDRRGARSAALEALAAVGLAERAHARVDTLSGGQQRRVMIARSLAEGADTLVLDEPLAGVDLANQKQLADTLGSMRGLTVVMVAHGLDWIADLVTRTVLLDAGRVVHDGASIPEGWAGMHHHSDPRTSPTILER